MGLDGGSYRAFNPECIICRNAVKDHLTLKNWVLCGFITYWSPFKERLKFLTTFSALCLVPAIESLICLSCNMGKFGILPSVGHMNLVDLLRGLSNRCKLRTSPHTLLVWSLRLPIQIWNLDKEVEGDRIKAYWRKNGNLHGETRTARLRSIPLHRYHTSAVQLQGNLNLSEQLWNGIDSYQ